MATLPPLVRSVASAESWVGAYHAEAESGRRYVLMLESSAGPGLEGRLEASGGGGAYVLRVQGLLLPGSGEVQILSLGLIAGEAPWGRASAAPDADVPLFSLAERGDGLLVTEKGLLPEPGPLSFWRR